MKKAANNYKSQIKVLQGLSHPVRFTILATLAKGEMSVGQLVDELDSSQSAVSQHLSKMKDAGIVKSHKESNFVYYSLKNPKYKELISLIGKLEV